MKTRILVVDDEASMREFLSIALGRMDHHVDAVGSAEEAIKVFTESSYDVVISDIKIPGGMNGVELLGVLKENDPAVQVILITAYASVDTAVKAVQLDALDYVIKPFKIEQIKNRIDNAMERRKLLTENRYLRKQIKEERNPSGILGESDLIISVREMIDKVAPAPSTVLISGESGTGKELVARALHDRSERTGGPFVSVNCGAIPEGLLESELFGHKKGSFTGAIQDKDGLFKVADSGTLFLDEIGETSPAIQVKLLRALQEMEVVPVGGTSPIKVDVRVLAATNAALEERVENGTFREDLYYRLNVVPIDMPPLRKRKEDIRLLAKHFLASASRNEKSFSEEALSLLEEYSWPGNVRELENIVELSMVMSEGSIVGIDVLPQQISKPPMEKLGALPQVDQPPDLEMIERAYVEWVLKQTRGVKTAAAEILGIDPSTLHRKMDKYGLKDEKEDESST